jgi:hypothetical protein
MTTPYHGYDSHDGAIGSFVSDYGDQSDASDGILRLKKKAKLIYEDDLPESDPHPGLSNTDFVIIG